MPLISNEPRYRWRLLRRGPLWLDGGSMFGVVPRVLWSKSCPPDEQGRILLGHNCLLLERIDVGLGPRRLVIESGSGDKFDPKMRKIFGLSTYSVGKAVAEANVRCEDIEAVIVTHLHFDHAGGLTRLPLDGEKPDWTGPGGSNVQPSGDVSVKITFPNAPVYVQAREWEDAASNRSVMTRTYLRENLDPLRDRIELIESPSPFSPGTHLNRDQIPAASMRQRETQILPGIHAFITPGHTWGQQAIRFIDDKGNSVVFVPDCMPTVHHVGAAYNMAYDVEPYMSTITRRWFLQAAVEENWLLVIDHEPGNPCQRVRSDGKGWFELTPEPEHSQDPSKTS